MKKYTVTLLIVLLGFKGFSQIWIYRISAQEYDPITKQCAPVDDIRNVLTETEKLKKDNDFLINSGSYFKYSTSTPVHDFSAFFSLNPQFELLDESFCPLNDTASTTKTFVVWDKEKARITFYGEKTHRTRSALVSLKQRIDSRINGLQYIFKVPSQRDVPLDMYVEEYVEEYVEDLQYFAIKVPSQREGKVLLSDEDNQKIGELSKILRQKPQFTLTIEVSGYNTEVVSQNALKIKKIFVEKGVPENQIELHTYSNSDPENADNITDPELEKKFVEYAILRIEIKR